MKPHVRSLLGLALGALMLMALPVITAARMASAQAAEDLVQPPADVLAAFGDCTYVVLFRDDTYIVCRDADEAADLLARFPYLAPAILAMGDLNDDQCGIFEYWWRASRPRNTTHIVSAGAEG